jgi:L-methionine (R)-S-oxide reductase
MSNSDEIISQVASLAESGADRDQLLRGAVTLLKEGVPYYNWVGIYLLEGDYLSLHNFIGKPTEHTRIQVGVGVCGAAVADRENKIVADVLEIENYLACSVETRAEIVVLIRRGDLILGQIDIDSDQANAFTAIDEALLTKVAEILATKL